MKRICALALSLCLLLGGCGAPRALSERAIVKALYLDGKPGHIEAALVVVTCKPSANTAEVTGEPKIYTGAGKTIDAALRDAEQKQNKQPFYAQNRLLLLGPNAVQSGVSPFLRYFGEEEVSRTNLSIFLTTCTVKQFEALSDSIADIVDEGERIVDGALAEGNASRGTHELHYHEDGDFYGYLPVLSLQKDSAARVQGLVVFANGMPAQAASGTRMQLALLLAGKAQRLNVRLETGDTQTTLITQRLRIERAVDTHNLTMTLTVRGRLESTQQNGRILQGAEEASALAECNAQLTRVLQQLCADTFAMNNDIFAFSWWLRSENETLYRRLIQEKGLYTQERVQLACEITTT